MHRIDAARVLRRQCSEHRGAVHTERRECLEIGLDSRSS